MNRTYILLITGALFALFGVSLIYFSQSVSTITDQQTCTTVISLPHPDLTTVKIITVEKSITIVYYEDPNKYYPDVISTETITIPCGYNVTYSIITSSEP